MNEKSVVLLCNACRRDFTLTTKLIKQRQSGELHFRYMLCPNCNAAFLISATDQAARKLTSKGFLTRAQAKRLSDELNAKYFPRFKELFPLAFQKEFEAQHE